MLNHIIVIQLINIVWLFEIDNFELHSFSYESSLSAILTLIIVIVKFMRKK